MKTIIVSYLVHAFHIYFTVSRQRSNLLKQNCACANPIFLRQNLKDSCILGSSPPRHLMFLCWSHTPQHHMFSCACWGQKLTLRIFRDCFSGNSIQSCYLVFFIKKEVWVIWYMLSVKRHCGLGASIYKYTRYICNGTTIYFI